MEITRHKVQTVRRMFQEFKLRTLDGLKCLASCMQTGTVMLQIYCLWQLSSLLHANSQLQFVSQKHTTAFTIHCFTFTWQCSCIGPFKSVACQEAVHPLHLFFHFQISPPTCTLFFGWDNCRNTEGAFCHEFLPSSPLLTTKIWQHAVLFWCTAKMSSPC